MILNGCLAGLVAITAPCAFVTIGSGAIIGFIAGVVAVFAVIGFDKMKIDDPVGALSVHLPSPTLIRSMPSEIPIASRPSGAHVGMGGRSRMAHQRTRIADVVGNIDQFERIEQAHAPARARPSSTKLKIGPQASICFCASACCGWLSSQGCRISGTRPRRTAPSRQRILALLLGAQGPASQAP